MSIGFTRGRLFEAAYKSLMLIVLEVTDQLCVRIQSQPPAHSPTNRASGYPGTILLMHMPKHADSDNSFSVSCPIRLI